MATQRSAKLCFKTPFGIDQWDLAKCKWETPLNSTESNTTVEPYGFHRIQLSFNIQEFLCSSKIDTKGPWLQCINFSQHGLSHFSMIKTSVMLIDFVSESSVFSNSG